MLSAFSISYARNLVKGENLIKNYDPKRQAKEKAVGHCPTAFRTYFIRPSVAGKPIPFFTVKSDFVPSCMLGFCVVKPFVSTPAL